LQHQGATSAVVTLAYETDCVTVEVENDEGEHLNARLDRPEGCGYGIVGMRERVAAVGGQLEARLRPEGGFRVLARLPLLPRS
jgi:signal transduction histidine kinase